MNKRIEAYVEALFADLPGEQYALDIKEELLSNLCEKYNDLIADGKTKEEAYSIVIASIGDVKDLFSFGAPNRNIAPAGIGKKRNTKGFIVIAIIVVAVLFIVFRINSATVLLKEEIVPLEDIHSISIYDASKKIEIVATNADQARVCQYGRPDKADIYLFMIDCADGYATINTHDEIGLKNSFASREKLVLELPASWIGNITVESQSGGIAIKDSFTWKQVFLMCNSGGVDLRGLIVEFLYITASSGGVKADGEITVESVFTVESDSGGIELGKPIKADSVWLKSSSGKMQLDEVSASDLDLSNDSGGIELGETSTKYFSLTNVSSGIAVAGITGTGSINNSSGGVDVRLNDPIGKVDISTNSGSVKISIAESIAFIFSGECTSGKIRSNFSLQESDNGEKASASIGSEPFAEINVTAASGGIRINQEN